jgi:hypothetical protein
MIWFVALTVFVALFAAGAILGAPYLPVLRRDSEALLALAALKPGQTVIDLGSGDGRFLRLAARHGYHGIGYEINPLLWLVSLVVCWPVRSNVKVYCRNYWNLTLPRADVIYVFLIDRYMPKLDAKLAREVTTPTRLVSYVFPIPHKKPVASTQNSYVYQYGNLSD